MTIDSSDPRLTAYILDELDEHQRGEIEAALADDTSANSALNNSAELRETVAQLRIASELLSAALGNGSSILDADQRMAPVACPAEPEAVTVAGQAKAIMSVGQRRRRYVVLALAAIVLFALTIPINRVLQSEPVAHYLFGSHGYMELVEGPVNATQFQLHAGPQATSQREIGYTIAKPVYESHGKVVPSATAEVGAEIDLTGNVFASGSGAVVDELGSAPTGEELSPRIALAGRTGKPAPGDRQGGGQQGSGQQGNQQWHYGYVAPGGTNVPNFNLKIDTNAHGGVPGQGGPPEARDGVDRYYRGRGADRLGELGDLQEGEIAGESEIQDHLALLPQRTLEAEKRLKEHNDIREAEDRAHNTEAYARIYDNRFLRPLDAPLSTFSIDVDTAAYANMRRFLRQGSLPPADSVRIEELVNYFSYQYAPPAEQDADKPFAVHTEVTACPWNPEHRLVRIALKGREIKVDARPPSNLVFLLDVSGSMDEPNKLPLVKRAMHLLVEKLGENDRVAIVVYAGASGLVLPSTTANNRETILAAIDNLTPGGSTNGASGIELAYQIAAANQIKEGVNRVILATDGDFNVGVTNDGDLTRLIEDKAKSGVFLTVLGFGMGNLKDSTLERLADKGNGNYGYIDTENEARKLLVDQLSGTLITIAKDVKLQIEFNPARVAGYRLLGYENRLLAAEDFNDDTKDAGEIGAGHAVTAFYEIVPVAPPAPEQPAADKPAVEKPADAAADKPADKPGEAAPPTETAPVDPLKYQRPAELTNAARGTPELLTLKLRYKEPEGTTSKLLEFGVADGDKPIGQASEDTRFAASVALFGMLLRQSPHAGSGTLAAVLEMADSSRQNDEHGYRAEFVELVKQAMTLVKPQQ